MTSEELTTLLGGHATSELGLRSHASGDSPCDTAEFFDDDALDRWLVVSCLLGGNVAPERGYASARALWDAGLALPSAIAKAGPLPVEVALVAAQHPKAEPCAHLLARVCRALEDRYDGSLASLASGADDLEDLAGRLSGLASGFGRAAIVRLLRPLREVWPLADEIPLDPAARAAAIHLGWIGDGEDVDGAPGALRSFLRSCADDGETSTHLCDVEAALERLGRKSCLRERHDRCPLEERCPGRRPA